MSKGLRSLGTAVYRSLATAQPAFQQHKSLAQFTHARSGIFGPVSQKFRPILANPNAAALCRALSSVPDNAGTRAFKKPTIEMAKSMPRAYSEMSNETLLVFSAASDFGANRERLIREIMVVDKVDWDGAQPRLKEMELANKELMFYGTLPYKIGFVGSVGIAIVSFPLCFHLDTVLWFNEHYVTADVAEPKDLETPLEVGSWAWSWMEPPLGQFSFFLLCFAFARNQLINLGIKPYTDWLKTFRAKRLQKKYPQYDDDVVHDFAVNDDWE
jgi:hypothetical protein